MSYSSDSRSYKRVLTVATGLISTLIVAAPAYAKNLLTPGQQLKTGQSLTSQNRCFTLVLQQDGNLVLYQNSRRRPLWATGTDGTAVERAIMQTDGNFVMYRHNGSPVWASNTDGKDGSRLIVQNDGNVVIYTPIRNRPVWATNTVRSCR